MADLIKQVQEKVKDTLEHTSQKYKAQVDKKRKDVQLQIDDKVWAYLRKKILPKGHHTKLQMKKIGTCTIFHKFGPNAYEISLPPIIAISPIFNVAYLTIFKDTFDVACTSTIDSHEYLLKDLPPSQPLELEAILETKIVK